MSTNIGLRGLLVCTHGQVLRRGTIGRVPSDVSPIHARAGAINHYENFPVASLLCPPALRAPIAAIYHFARTADDIADEGDANAFQRLQQLGAYRAEFDATQRGETGSGRWDRVFGPLTHALQQFALPTALLHDLLDAFEQDIVWTGERRRYRDDAELMDYCRRSANPVGRLLLHLYGISDAIAPARSDQICSALQLINFWQDLGGDLARGRIYPSLASCARFGLDEGALFAGHGQPQARALLADYCGQARSMMLAGAPLALQIPGRAGWELRLVVQGGLRILDKIEAQGFDTWSRRPRLRPWDVLLMLWRAWRMPAQ